MSYSDLFVEANYDPAGAPFYGQTGQPTCAVNTGVEPQLAHWAEPAAPGGRSAPGARKVAVTPMWVALNDADGTTYTLMADNDAVRLDLIKSESLDKVKPQPAAWLVTDGKVAALSVDEVKMLTSK